MESSCLRIPSQFLDQTLIAIFRCFGLHSPTHKQTVFPEEEEAEYKTKKEEEEEEEEDIEMRERAVGLLTIRKKVKRKARKKESNRKRNPTKKENPSTGNPGQVNRISSNGGLTLNFVDTSSSSSSSPSSHTY